MKQQDVPSRQALDKAAVDASPAGSMTISTDSCAIDPAAFGQILAPLLEKMQKEDGLALNPLRLVLLTANLGDTVRRWQRALGLAEAGVSQQSGGSAAAKTMSWGTDEESARSIIVMADYLAAGVTVNNSVAITTITHELGHVHDEFLRGVTLGFPKSQTPPMLADWPRVRDLLAEISWSEFAAESVAARHMTQEDLGEFLLNDPQYLAGIDERLRQAVWSYKRKGCTLAALWSSAVTDLSDLFGNLGRTIARLPYADNGEAALARLLDPEIAGGRWKAVIEGLGSELETLGDQPYAKWGADPFGRIAERVTEGFQAVGLFPLYDGTDLNVRVK